MHLCTSIINTTATKSQIYLAIKATVISTPQHSTADMLRICHISRHAQNMLHSRHAQNM